MRVIKNKIDLLREKGPKRDEQTGEWSKLHYVEPLNLYGNVDIIRTLKSLRLRWWNMLHGWDMEEGQRGSRKNGGKVPTW